MTYPYIGKNKHGVKALIYSRNSARILNGECAGQMHDMSVVDNDWFKSKYENITADYLRNTKVKIESEEHAWFIQSLAFEAGYVWGDGLSKNIELSGGCIIFDKDNMTIRHTVNPSYSVYKKITIPLPPKESEEWPQIGDSFIHKGELVKCISKGVMGNGDEVITFEFSDGLSHGSCWNNESWVKKPPTPEEELESKLSALMGSDSCSSCGDIAKAIINGEIKGLSYKPD